MDSVKFSGGVVAGLSLVSAAVMRLVRQDAQGAVSEADEDHVDLLLAPGSLYVLQGPARFEYAHAIVEDAGRGRRLSVIFRDER